MFSSLGVLVESSRGTILDYSIKFNVRRCYGLMQVIPQLTFSFIF